jgi:hypothetical protein
MRRQLDTDRAMADLATRQHGLITRAQLLACGLQPAAIDRRVRARRLHVVHRGVYAVGHRALTQEARWLAAVLACGPLAVLSHGAAARLWGLLERWDGIDVSVPSAAGRSGPVDVRVHRVPSLDRDDVRRRARIPVTSPVRTLVDLSPLVTRRRMERLLDEAHVLRLCTPAQVRLAVRGRVGRPGMPLLTSILDGHDVGSTLTESELEERFLDLCAQAGLSMPTVNEPGVAGRVDFTWPALRLAVETDGWRFHRTQAAVERDRAKEARLVIDGWRVLRFTWRQIVYRPASVIAALRASMSS